jgi:O-antigen/teichoic acid export membrane protein
MQMSQQRSRRIRGVVSLGTGVAVLVALGSSLLYFLWVASIRNSDQIGQLSIGTLVVGLACAFAALMLAFSMIRAIRRAEDGRALLAALLAGGFAIAAALALAASDVLGKLAA